MTDINCLAESSRLNNKLSADLVIWPSGTPAILSASAADSPNRIINILKAGYTQMCVDAVPPNPLPGGFVRIDFFMLWLNAAGDILISDTLSTSGGVNSYTKNPGRILAADLGSGEGLPIPFPVRADRLLLRAQANGANISAKLSVRLWRL